MKESKMAFTMPSQKNIALIAHDNKKSDLIEWCKKNKKIGFAFDGDGDRCLIVDENGEEKTRTVGAISYDAIMKIVNNFN